jgi:cytoskeletal protein RodZ
MHKHAKAITPAKAARLHRQDEKKRREKRLSRWLLIGFVILATAAVGADYLWLRAMARQRREQHERRFHHGQTNAPAHIPPPGATNRTPAT